MYGVVDLQGEVTIDATYDYICYDKYADDKKGGMLVFEKADDIFPQCRNIIGMLQQRFSFFVKTGIHSVRLCDDKL